MGLLADKVIVVTGAGSGIGKATAIKLSNEGARLTLVDNNPDSLAQTVQLIPSNSNLLAIPFDVRDESAWQQAISATLTKWNKLNGLVNCAGVALRKTIQETSLSEFQDVLAVNLEGSFLGLKHGYLAMRNNKDGGSIVNVSSVLGQLGMAGYCAYSASKGGSRLMTKAAAIEFGMANTLIRVNSVHPGVVATPLVEQENIDQLQQKIPLKKTAQPEDIANSIAFLLADGSSFMTGSEVTVDGGWTCGLPFADTPKGDS